MLPSISIAMATFNEASFLHEQLQSLATQTYLPNALWITDDGSIDATKSIVDEFFRKAPFPVRFSENETRLGYGRNFLKAASFSNCDYVAFCDQDDVWVASKLECVSKTVKQYAPGLIVHSGRVVDKQLKYLGQRFPAFEKIMVLESCDKKTRNFWPGFALVVNRKLLHRAGVDQMILNDNLCVSTFAHDQWLCETALRTSTCVQLADDLVLYRQHDSNLIGFPVVDYVLETIPS